MAWLPGQVNVGMVANPGRDRRKELRGLLGLSPKEKLVYFYVGRYGQNDLDWGRLEGYAPTASTSSAITPHRLDPSKPASCSGRGVAAAAT